MLNRVNRRVNAINPAALVRTVHRKTYQNVLEAIVFSLCHVNMYVLQHYIHLFRFVAECKLWRMRVQALLLAANAVSPNQTQRQQLY